MFEGVCLLCGKHLDDDCRAYCSDECQYLDSTSPSISSASSAYSSPHIAHAVGGDVPPLVSSALGVALHAHSGHYSISSSSPSSTAWSLTADEDEDFGLYSGPSDHSSLDLSDYINKPPQFINANMSYARRPSGTNTRSVVPQLHRRTSSSSSRHLLKVPLGLSSGSNPHSSDEEFLSDFGLSPKRSLFDQDQPVLPKSAPDQQYHERSTITPNRSADTHPGERHKTITKPKRSHNRSSLPTYFSLLKLGHTRSEPVVATSTAQPQPRSSPQSSPECSRGSHLSNSSSSMQTIAKPSPPTPKVSNATTASVSLRTQVQNTPKPNRRELVAAFRHQVIRRRHSPSRSTSRTRLRRDTHTEATLSKLSPKPVSSHPGPETDMESESDLEVPVPNHHTAALLEKAEGRRSITTVFDWSSAPPRGRTAVRRNSSPPPKVLSGLVAFEQSSVAMSPPHRTEDTHRLPRRTRDSQSRGRVRVEELEGRGTSRDAPGFGNGRSGLLHRETEHGHRTHHPQPLRG